MSVQRCIDEILVRGCDDWVYLAEVLSVVKLTGGARSAGEVRSMTMLLLRELTQQGLMQLGELPDQGRSLVLWPMAADACLERVEREWDRLGREPSLGEVCWLQSTELGVARGEEVMKRCGGRLTGAAVLRQVLEGSPWLFEECGFQVAASAYEPSSFGNTFVDLESTDMRIRVVLDRGLLSVDVGVPERPGVWWTLREVCGRIGVGENGARVEGPEDVGHLLGLVREHRSALVKAMRAERAVLRRLRANE